MSSKVVDVIFQSSTAMQTYLDLIFAAILNAFTINPVIRPKVEFYLECPEVHVFIVEVSTLCQFGKMAFGEGKSEKIHSLVSRRALLMK